MSQRRPGKCWAALIAPLRNVVSLAAVAIALSACSIAELEKLATEGEGYGLTPTPAASARQDTGLSQKVGLELLMPETVIMGGQQDEQGFGGQIRRLTIGAAEEVKLSRPVAVGGTGNLLYIVDAEPNIVFQYDLTTHLFRPIVEIGTYLVGDPGNIFVTKDRSFYLVDSLGKQVLHFSETGTLLGKFQDLANLSRPMAVVVDEMTGNVFVADGSFSHVIVFNPFGKALRALGQRGSGPGRFRAITAMAIGADGLFVTDRLELPVQVFNWDGSFRYAFGEGELTFPIAIAVDADQRVFVSDEIDNTLRVYQDGQLLMTFGGGGAAPGRFRMPAGLWVNGERLFVADSLNRRVQVLRINPDAPLPATGGN